MKISERLRKDADHIWKRIFEHPFVVELYSGALPIDKFKFYILQDYNYLISAIKNFNIICSRAESVDAIKELVEIIHLEAVSEFEGYETFLGKLGYTIKDAVNVEPSFVNISYVSFLLSTSSLKSFGESLASVLPCFWSYADIAEYHKDTLKKNENGLYVEWASVYLAESYIDLVNKFKMLVDNVGDETPYEKLRDTFMTASRYEYMYWDAMYNMHSWPV